jgi:hypothetical protein
MLRVKIEMDDANLPPGHPRKVQVIAEAVIINLGTNNAGLGDKNPLGDYLAQFSLHGKPWGESFVFNYDRRNLPVWTLLDRALRGILDKDSVAEERS